MEPEKALLIAFRVIVGLTIVSGLCLAAAWAGVYEKSDSSAARSIYGNQLCTSNSDCGTKICVKDVINSEFGMCKKEQ